MKNGTGITPTPFKLLSLILCSLLYACSGDSGSTESVTSVTEDTTSEVSSIDVTETTTNTNDNTNDNTNTTTDTTADTTTETTTDTARDSDTDTATDSDTDNATDSSDNNETTIEPELELEQKADNIISVLFIYSSDFSSEYDENIDLRLQQLINTANQSFQDSTLSVEFTIAGSAEVEFDKLKTDAEVLTAITCDLDLVGRNQGCVRSNEFSFVTALREQTKADIISFVRPYHSSRNNQCGLGWVSGAGYDGDISHPFWKETTVNVVNVDGPCTEWTFAHEIGHNLGLTHGALQDTTGGTLPWAWGYGEYNSFSTIMTYRYLYGNNAQSIYRFSNPEQVCKNSMCGISKDESNGADAVSALRITIPQIAAFQLSEDDLANNNLETLETAKSFSADAEQFVFHVNFIND